jgi:hypothetical protein
MTEEKMGGEIYNLGLQLEKFKENIERDMLSRGAGASRL